MQILIIFILGVCILAGAIVLNILASFAGLASWYDFVRAPRETNLISYVWLFGLYPFSLGLIAYVSSKFLNF